METYEHTKTIQRDIGQADIRRATDRNDTDRRDGGGRRKEGGKGRRKEKRQAKVVGKEKGRVRDADAPLHILTFRSLCTMSCW